MVELDVGRKLTGLVSRDIFRRREIVILITEALFVEAGLIKLNALFLGLGLSFCSSFVILDFGSLGFTVGGLLLNVLASNVHGQEQQKQG